MIEVTSVMVVEGVLLTLPRLAGVPVSLGPVQALLPGEGGVHFVQCQGVQGVAPTLPAFMRGVLCWIFISVIASNTIGHGACRHHSIPGLLYVAMIGHRRLEDMAGGDHRRLEDIVMAGHWRLEDIIRGWRLEDMAGVRHPTVLPAQLGPSPGVYLKEED